MMRATGRLAILALAVLPLAAHAAGQDPRVAYRDATYPGSGPADARQELVVRVVDGITGAPLPGATVHVPEHAKYPVPGEFATIFDAPCDPDGFARLPYPRVRVAVKAPGYATGTCDFHEDGVFPMLPAQPVPVQVLDWRGLPLAGYPVGWCGSCGHMPDLGNAVTGHDGVAWFRAADPGNSICDLYVQHAPIGFEYWDITWQPGDPPDVHAYGPGRMLRGRVLQADGSPAARAFVGTYGKHRGPWSRADDDGWFVVGGLEDSGFMVAFGDREYDYPWPDADPCTLTLPAVAHDPVVSGEPQPSGPHGTLRCTATVRGEPDAEPDVYFSTYGPEPLHAWDSSDDDFDLVAGRHRVVVRNAAARDRAPDREYFPAERTVDVAPGTVTELAFELVPLPAAVLRVAPPADLEDPDDWSIELIHTDHGRDITEAVRDGEPVQIDPGREYAVELRVGEQRRVFAMTGQGLLHPAIEPFRCFPP
ncbi:MAG: hypothetical protein AB7O97_00970, partial [Planctomycetota bacterium]